MISTLVVVLGPTGVGKTELCLTLAKRLGCDIINCDSRQLFSELPIGTAAPLASQRQEVRHHFVGTLTLDQYYSASEYERDVMQLLSGTPSQASGMQPLDDESGVAILTGGSMMYIDAVCNGIDEIPTIDESLREHLKQRLDAEGLDALVEELRLLDPEYWEIVDRKNPRRILHALEICRQTGATYTSLRKREHRQRPFRIVKIGLTRDRDELYERINARVLTMVADGLEAEARSVYPYRTLNSLNTVGYKEMFSYFDGDIPFEEAVRQIQSNSRRYMRKQMTWFKRDEAIRWFSPTQLDDIIDYALEATGKNTTTQVADM